MSHTTYFASVARFSCPSLNPPRCIHSFEKLRSREPVIRMHYHLQYSMAMRPQLTCVTIEACTDDISQVAHHSSCSTLDGTIRLASALGKSCVTVRLRCSSNSSILLSLLSIHRLHTPCSSRGFYRSSVNLLAFDCSFLIGPTRLLKM